jgi:hypothetical protein
MLQERARTAALQMLCSKNVRVFRHNIRQYSKDMSVEAGGSTGYLAEADGNCRLKNIYNTRITKIE